ncbi:MAG: ferric uptake regulator, Fur family [Chloroflexi bacterium]|nr:ferric uptake regulator, Fur family [Chloroflexota bacterium]
MTAATTLLAALEGSGHRTTGPRRIVAELVAGQDGAFTAVGLESAARAGGVHVGRATIFRAIELFESLGVVERVDLPAGDHAYVACVSHHHHHVICTTCGRSTEVEDVGIEALARTVGRRTGFRVDEHRLELFGICPDCQRVASGT